MAAARKGVLFMNLKSGGGKAERFHLVDECTRPWDRAGRAGGRAGLGATSGRTAPKHDVVGMAGGDGSQAIVGSIAAELGLPMVVVPAGTRNHLALDLGLDRDDVVGALDAYGDAVERPMDLADVNGKVFVNNVSLGRVRGDRALARVPRREGGHDARRTSEDLRTGDDGLRPALRLADGTPRASAS